MGEFKDYLVEKEITESFKKGDEAEYQGDKIKIVDNSIRIFPKSSNFSFNNFMKIYRFIIENIDSSAEFVLYKNKRKINMKCEICNEEDAKIRLDDDDLKLKLCWECYNQGYLAENIKWIYI